MKIAVVGLGAVGGLLAARLTQAGAAVQAVARGATLAAVRAHGVRLQTAGSEEQIEVPVTDRVSALGPQDLVILAVKAPALGDAAARLAPLLHDETVVLPAMNGVPWWFLQTSEGRGIAPSDPGDMTLQSVDPGSRIAAALPLRRVLGGVVHLTAEAVAPGVVRHGFGQRLIIGEPAGGLSARSAAVCRVLATAGFEAEASADVRSAIWYKLWGNMTTNPISALTGVTTDRILDDELVCAFMLGAMAEAAAIGARIGCPIAQSGHDRIVVTRQLGAFRTSMLQDARAGRPLEIDALIGAVHEIGARVGIDTPHIGALFGLTRLMARERGLYPPSSP